MAGIYIHIPFCRKKCHYCNFFSLATNRYRQEFYAALLAEISLQKSYLEGETVETIYFGGGSPSLLDPREVKGILDQLASAFSVVESPEISLEANPDDLDIDKLKAYRKAGINRLSIGVQSFHDEDLLFLNRSHTGETALRVIREARETGFRQLSIDLIYGIPGLTDSRWLDNLEITARLEIPHLSAYWLTIEEGTALASFIRRGKVPPPDDEEGIVHFRLLRDWARQNAYLQYEVSNFCRNNAFSKHNTSYWKGESYLGLGPSAHSFNGYSRQWNVSRLGLYIEGVKKGIVPASKEDLSETMKFNEYVMTSLRTVWGIDREFLQKNFGEKRTFEAIRGLRVFLERGWVKQKAGAYILDGDGWLHADGIAANLFAIDEGIQE